MRSRALALLPGILMAMRLLLNPKALSAVKPRQPFPGFEKPASEKKHRTHDSLALAPIDHLRLPVNFDSSHSALSVVYYPSRM